MVALVYTLAFLLMLQAVETKDDDLQRIYREGVAAFSYMDGGTD